MSKLIRITESQNKAAMKCIMENFFPVNPSQVLIIKDFLDKNFVKGEIEELGGINGGETDGILSYNPVVGFKDKNGEVKGNYSASQLLEYLFDRYKSMISNKDDRRRFLIQVIKDWYYNRITKDGMLSVMYC